MNNTSTMVEHGKDAEKCDKSIKCFTMDDTFLNDLLECSVCMEQLDSSSKVLPCQHTFCKRCLHAILNSHKELRCPECRVLVDIKIEELPCNILLVRLLEGIKNNVRPKRAGSTLEVAPRSAESSSQLQTPPHPELPQPLGNLPRTPSATDLSIVPKQDSNYTLYRTIKGHKSAISSVKFSPSGDFLASCSYDKQIKIWSSYDGELQDTLVGHKKGISEIAWSHHNQLLVSASYDKTLKIWDTSKAKCLKTLKESAAVFCAKFSPKSDLILSGSKEYARLWSTHTGEWLKSFKFHEDRVTAVDFDLTANGNLMLTSSNDGYCHVYDARAEGIVHCIQESASISYAKFSRNGRYILTATLDSTIKIWNILKGKYVKVYTGHKNRKYPLFADYTAGGKWIVSGSEDNMVYVWDLNSKHITQVLEGHSDVALCVDCHPCQNVIASGGLENDKTVRIWKG